MGSDPDLDLGTEPASTATESEKPILDSMAGGSGCGCNRLPGAGVGIVAEFRFFVCQKLVKRKKTGLALESYSRTSPIPRYRMQWFHYCNIAIDDGVFPTE